MTDLKKELVNLIGTGRPKKILIERAGGSPLDDIGLKFAITRERARQIETKPKQKIRDWLSLRKKEILEELSDNGTIINKEKAESFFGKENFSVLCYCVHERRKNTKGNGWFHMPEIQTIAFSENMEFYNLFYGLIEKCKAGEVNIQELCKSCQRAGYSFVTEDFIMDFAKKAGFKIYDNQIFDRRLTIGKAIQMAAKGKFRDGINITDDEQMKEFADYLNINYDQDVKPGRALATRIQNTLVMYKKATYVSAENIAKCDELDEKIKECLKKTNCLLSYLQIFKMLDKKLMEENSIYTQENLAGYLRANEKKLGIRTNRYYVELTNEHPEIEQSKEYFQQMVDYLKEKNTSVDTQTILKDLHGWTELYPKYAMFYFPQIVQWNPKEYLCLDIFDFDKKSSEIIKKTVTEKLDNELQYANAFVIYKEVKEKYPEIIEKFRIKNENHMFYIIKHIYYLNGWSEVSFRKPHIYADKGMEDKLSTEKLIDKLAAKTDVISKEYLSDQLLKYYGRKNNSLFLAIQKSMKKYARISQDEYTAPKNIVINEKDAKVIRDFIMDHIKKEGYLVPTTCKEDYKTLPKPHFKTKNGRELLWNSWLLITVTDVLKIPVKILNRRNNASQNTMIIVSQDSSLNSKEDFVLWILKTKFSGDILSRDAYEFLHNLDIFAANYPYQEMRKFVEKALAKET